MKSHAPLPVRILTHNIRYATPSPFPGEKPWSDRKHLIIAELKFLTSNNPESFICLQEVLHEQLIDILAGLNNTQTSPPDDQERPTTTAKDEWTHIGVGRDDGAEKGEYSPILFRPSVWSLTRFETVWLSPTPDRPGKGWDAASIRIVTVGSFVHRASRQRVVGLCTHFDEQGAVSRRESAGMISGIVEREAESAEGGVWVAGDLNSEMSGDAYRVLTAEGSGLRDAREVAKWTWGEEKTFTGFGQDGEEETIIDYVFLGRGWGVEGASVLPNRFEEGVYCSDHRAVVVDALLGA